MKVYMFNEEEAIKNKCLEGMPPQVKFALFIVMISFLIFVPLLVSVIVPIYIGILLWILYVAFVVLGFYKCLIDLRMKKWAYQTAFVQEEDTLWAVKLLYIHFPVSGNLVAATASAIDNQQKQEELEERIIYPENYVQALVDARGSSHIRKDMDKNYTFIFNGSESVIRLDEVSFVKETKITEIYSYKNHKGKTVTLEVIKAYPGLREAVLDSKPVNHAFPFPKQPV